MKLYVLTGDDLGALAQRRAQIIDAAVADNAMREDHDVALDGGAALVGAASSPGLFAPKRVVAAENFDQIDDASLGRLAQAATGSDAVIVARCGSAISAAARKQLKGFAEFETFAAPRGKGVSTTVNQILAQAGITVDGRARAVITERAEDDISRVRSMVAQLHMAGIDTPSARQVEVLLGVGTESGVPWQITDRLDAGDAAGAIAAARHCEPIPALAFLRSRIDMAGRALESGERNADRLADILGVKAFPARQASALGQRLGTAGVRQAITIVSAHELGARSGIGAETSLTLAVAQLAPLWRRR